MSKKITKITNENRLAAPASEKKGKIKKQERRKMKKNDK